MSKTQTLLILAAVLFVAACAEPKKTRGTANGRGTRTTNPDNKGGNGTVAGTSLNCSGADWGVIYSNGSTSAWRTNLEQFVSASIDPAEMGYVSNLPNDSKTGVSFCGRICGNNSEVYIGVWDDKVNKTATPPIDEIAVNIKGSTSINNGVQFQDSYGLVRFVGNTTTPQGTVTGKFYFQNKVPTQTGLVELGDFEITAGRFFNRCN